MQREENVDPHADFGVLVHRTSDRHNLPFHRSKREEENDTSRKFLRQGKLVPLMEDGVCG